MSIKVSNSPVSIYAREGIKDAGRVLSDVSKKFATGKKFAKPSEDLFAFIEAQIGEATMIAARSAQSNLGRLRSILSSRNGALEVMRTSVQELSNIALQAAGALPAEVREANKGVFSQVMQRVTEIARDSTYGGINLLDGTFGSTGEFERKLPLNNTVAVFESAPTTLRTESQNRVGTLTFVDNAQAGDTITVGGEVFTYVASEANYENNEILVGSDKTQSARNAFDALQESMSVNVKKFGFSLDAAAANPAITLTQLASSYQDLSTSDFSSSSTGTRITQAYTAAPDANNLLVADNYTATGSLGQLGHMGHIGTTDGVAERAKFLEYAEAAGSTIGAFAGAAHANDALTKFVLPIGGQNYYAYHFSSHSNAGAFENVNGVDNTVYVIKETDDAGGSKIGKVMGIRLQAGVDLSAAGQPLTFLTAFNVDSDKIKFKQRNHMNIDTSGGDILVNKIGIGTVKGMTVELESDKFDGLKVQDFTIDSSNLKAVIVDADGNRKEFVSPLSPNVKLAGTKLVFTDADSGDKLYLTLGGQKNLNLSSDEYRKAAATAIKRALGSSESSTFIVGTDVSQKLTLDLGDMSWNILTANNTLSIDSQTAAEEATGILNEVIQKINAEIGITASYDKAVDSLVDQIEVQQENLAASIEDLTALDVSETREQLDSALQVYTACIASIRADQQAKQLLNQLLQL
jgi:flagellin-like hook-associated protein FlgL